MSPSLREENRLAQAVAVLSVVLVGTRFFVAADVTVGLAVALILVPLWLPAVRRYSGATTLMLIGVCAILSGAWLTDLASATHPTSLGDVLDASLMVLGMLGSVGVLLWARQTLPIWLIGALFGLGMLLTVVVSGTWDAGNPWKYGIGFPLMIVILALAGRPGIKAIDLSALLVLSVFSVMSDSRYRFASLMIAVVLVGWQMLPKPTKRRTSVLTTVAVFSAITVLVYNLATAVLVEGYLGEQAQARSIEQLDRSGSLIIGGRPELAATIALFLDRPFGFGSGVFSTSADILTAKTGMASIGYEPNNRYVELFMFGGGIELHSVAGDLWAAFGIPGLVFVLMGAVIVLRSLARALAGRTATGLLSFLFVSTLWNVLFSPIYSSLPTLVLTLGLALLPRARSDDQLLARSGRMRASSLSQP